MNLSVAWLPLELHEVSEFAISDAFLGVVRGPLTFINSSGL
jgi:hypothetical protein